MKAKLRKDGDVTIVSLIGRLDFETAEPFRETCRDVLINNKVVFNMEELSFVGSSGIGAFITTLREFAKSNPVTPRFCNVRSEFQKIFKTTLEVGYEVYEGERDALRSFVDPTVRPLNLSFIEDGEGNDDFAEDAAHITHAATAKAEDIS